MGYYEHPPATAVLTKIFARKGSEISVRLPSLIFWLISAIVYFLFAKMLFREDVKGKMALYSSLLFISTPLLFFVLFFAVQEYPLMLFWILSVILLWKISEQPNNKINYILFGIFLGFALLSKYTAILTVPSYFLFLMLVKDFQPLKFFKYSILIAVAIFSPVIIWNIQHGSVSFIYQLKKGFVGIIPEIVNFNWYDGLFGEFLFDIFWGFWAELATLTPLVFIIFFGGLVLGCGKDKREKFLWSFTFFPFIFFSFASLFSPIEVHWIDVSLPTGFISGIRVLHKLSEKIKLPSIFDIVALLSILSSSLLSLFFCFHFLGFITLPAYKFGGWRDFSAKIEQCAKKYNTNTVIVSSGRWDGSEINFYSDLEVLWDDRRDRFLIDKKIIKGDIIIVSPEPWEIDLKCDSIEMCQEYGGGNRGKKFKILFCKNTYIKLFKKGKEFLP